MATNRVPYRTSLRVLGRLLNGDKARMVTVCEIDDGFLLHYFVQGDPCRVMTRAIHGAEVLDLDDLLHGQRGKPEPDGSFKGFQSGLGFRQSDALKFQKTHPLCPMGYENFLRALGEMLDRRHAQAILIHELDDNVHVEYTIERADFVLRDGVRMALAGRREEHYTANGIDGLVRKCREQTDEKVRRNGQTLSYNPLDVASYLDTAQTLEDDGHYRDAEELFRTAARLAPTHPEAHHGLARLARRRGDRKAALKSLQSATTLDPANGRYLHLLGRINMERGQLEDAVAALQQAAILEPGNRMYLFDLSRAYERLGRHDEASAVLMRYGTGVSARATARTGQAAAPATPPEATSIERRAARASSVRRADTPGDAPTGARETRQDEPVRWGSAREERTESQAPDNWTSFPPPAAPWGSTPAATPFAGEAPPWGTTAGRPGTWDSASGEGAGAPVETATVLPDDASPSGPGLPSLGLALANDWATQALPSVHVPADGEAAAAALPLAMTAVSDRRQEVGNRSVMPPLSAPVDESNAGRKVIPPSTDDAAVQLAAAIMRTEDLARAEPHRAELHRKLGFLLAKQGRSEEAAAEFRRAVECGRRRMTE